MNRPMYYRLKPDHSVEPSDSMQIDDRRVALDKDVAPGAEVSTVFLGLDHAFGDGPPVLFETMVFGGPLDGEQDRYCTWDEAVAGHAAMLARGEPPRDGRR